MESFEKSLCVKEAASVLNTSTDTVIRRIEDKELKAWKLPPLKSKKKGSRDCNHWRITVSELLAFMKRNANKSSR